MGSENALESVWVKDRMRGLGCAGLASTPRHEAPRPPQDPPRSNGKVEDARGSGCRPPQSMLRKANCKPAGVTGFSSQGTDWKIRFRPGVPAG
jgi:hypothetical protein